MMMYAITANTIILVVVVTKMLVVIIMIVICSVGISKVRCQKKVYRINFFSQCRLATENISKWDTTLLTLAAHISSREHRHTAKFQQLVNRCIISLSSKFEVPSPTEYSFRSIFTSMR